MTVRKVTGWRQKEEGKEDEEKKEQNYRSRKQRLNWRIEKSLPTVDAADVDDDADNDDDDDDMRIDDDVDAEEEEDWDGEGEDEKDEARDADIILCFGPSMIL